ncbi:hypothetical protein QBC40DRAFT_343221 [Triangularia verruculosa]|uniref:Uncharacterized protein n=1 Tax=Triangularia verruculosa TaxID=2587418 RepID=A0AAN6XAE1_9PEZI|nr:hypothetical protein QBC40DRAFT_343221 [Triangularia verruculosa]
MCFHKRLLFACSHYAWLTTPESIVPCEVEKRFTRGCVAGYNGNPDGDANDSENETMSELCGDTSSLPQPTPAASGPEEGCNQMWSHGFFTTRVGEDCQSCVRKSRRRQSKISEAREVIRALKTNLEKMTSGELFYCPDENDDSNDLEGGGDERREDWGLTVRSQNSDSTRTSAGIGLESSFTSSPRRSSKTDTVDTSVSLDYRSEKDLGLVEECLVDESESKNERMEEVSFVFDPRQCKLLFSPAVTAVEV